MATSRAKHHAPLEPKLAGQAPEAPQTKSHEKMGTKQGDAQSSQDLQAQVLGTVATIGSRGGYQWCSALLPAGGQ
jgi:hypothetical protein